ncbi:uncharacterized protein [Salminus brasiliensis]|uniref:uncharacterized protein isoform X2 n=1 Tax=Salminus brasiliensis TaxID=930266 RepID=UPI003B83797F
MGVCFWAFLSGLFLICEGLHVLGPSGPLTVELGGSLMLPCYVESPLPLEELEVEWKRTGSESLVHLFQVGESRPESQSQAYSGRARFFTEEIKHGNFSLLLTDLTSKDAGVYSCTVYRQQETGQASVEIMDVERLVVVGGHVISAYAREDITLNCSVDSHIPPEKLEEVSWKKVDQQIPVLIYQDGAVQAESTHERYMDRVEFFGTEEIHRGNFSLRLKELQTEDKGLYICEVFSGEFSANTTVEIQVGLSHIHNMVLFLCVITCLSGASLLFGCVPMNHFKGPGTWIIIIQNALVFCPNMLMCAAFIFWGVLKGFLIGTVTCLVVSVLRTGLLLLFSPYCCRFQENTIKFIKAFPFLEYCAVLIIFAVVVGQHGWGIQDKGLMGLAGTLLVLSIIIVLFIILDTFLPASRCLFYCGLVLYILMIFLDLIIFIVLMDLFVAGKNIEANGNAGLICMMIFMVCLLVLALRSKYRNDRQSTSSNSALWKPDIIGTTYMVGAAVMFLVNSVTLAVELFTDAGNELRVILLPFECAFVICCLFTDCCCHSRDEQYQPTRTIIPVSNTI